MNYPIRINKYLRDKGLASRREADELIAVGKVFVNGRPAKEGMMISEKDKVELRQEKKIHRYLAYYKPRGLATQAELEKESVVSHWQKEGLFPIGRLDKESEGLMILTDDRQLTSKILGSESGVEKEYIVRVRESLRKNVEAIFKKGMQTESLGALLPAEAEIESEHSLRIILREGKKHQIRVMLSELGYTVESLKRVRIGKISLGNLKPGKTKVLTLKEVQR
ncbi:MAG: pseudouridine synthase [Patescibacteria group bacterium]